MAELEDQQFCLRWNNFQANITSQFEALRDDEDFTDVTIACDGQRLQAHKVVLSACSPFFKEIFKNNPCQHPVIFMRDVEVQHIVSLLEFMYAGQVNVAQANLSGFLKTAESLKIRGLTDTTDNCKETEESPVINKPISSKPYAGTHKKKLHISSSSTVTSSQDISIKSLALSPPPSKRPCKNDRTETDTDIQRLRQLNVINEDTTPNLTNELNSGNLQLKEELPDYLSDEEKEEHTNYFNNADIPDLTGGMEVVPHLQGTSSKDLSPDMGLDFSRFRRRSFSENWLTYEDVFENPNENHSSYISHYKEYRDGGDKRKNKLVKLAEGIEIYEEQLRSVKWSDYRKLTRGLATILFSPAELATCSVTGQRWSRAGSGERPVKPALDRAKVQAIISYVATRFPMVEISRIKQVLAYKCKENSTALKMKAVRFYGDQLSDAKQ